MFHPPTIIQGTPCFYGAAVNTSFNVILNGQKPLFSGHQPHGSRSQRTGRIRLLWPPQHRSPQRVSRFIYTQTLSGCLLTQIFFPDPQTVRKKYRSGKQRTADSQDILFFTRPGWDIHSSLHDPAPTRRAHRVKLITGSHLTATENENILL